MMKIIMKIIIEVYMPIKVNIPVMGHIIMRVELVL